MSERVYYCRPDAEPKLYRCQAAGEGRVDILNDQGRVIVAGARLVTAPKEGCAMLPDALDAPELPVDRPKRPAKPKLKPMAEAEGAD